MAYNLNNLKLLTQGGEADIYDIDEDRILRVMRSADSKSIDNEKRILPIMAAHNVSVPTVYEYIEVDGRPAEVMQKISGGTMLEHMTRHPLTMIKENKRFAKLHVQLLSIASDCDIYTRESNFDYLKSQPLLIAKELFDFVMKLFSELPKGKNICHGDFHPGNILIQDGRDYIIDWSGACLSRDISDIAHTYLLMTHVPVIPGQSYVQYKILSIAGSYMARSYLKEVMKLMKVDLAEFSKWTVVMSLFRVYYGLPSEKAERIRYMESCYSLSQKGTDATLWYKLL